MRVLLILSIDTSCSSLQVALTQGGTVLYENTANYKKTHSVKLMPEIERALSSCGITVSEIDMIACVNGPGSYTGLRIGVATGKLLAYSLSLPLVTVKTPDFLAASAGIAESAYLCACIDARNTQMFYSIYKTGDGNRVPQRVSEYKVASAEEICEELLVLLADAPKKAVYFTGDGVLANRQLLKDRLGECYHEAPAVNLLGRAAFVGLLAEQQYLEAADKSVFLPDAAEVFYLRTPHLTVKKSGGDAV